MSTFLCSLRPGPAAASWKRREKGSVPHFYTKGATLTYSQRRVVGPGLLTRGSSSGGLRGIGPKLAGNVGTGWAFALAREGDQDVDVPMLAPARSRCRFVEAQESSGNVRRSESPNGAPYTSPG
jgi:hypothetical protein